MNNFNIEQFLDLTNYATDTRVARRKTGKKTQEFFTPYSIVKRMCDKIPDEDLANQIKTRWFFIFIYIIELMKNKEELEKKTEVKRFSVCVMNPPYSQRIKNEPLHFKFVEKCNEIANNQITIMPSKILKATSERDKIWKTKLSNNLMSVDEVDPTVFKETSQPVVGIFKWKSNYNKDIKIKFLDGAEINIYNLINIKFSNQTEDEIMNILNNNNNIILFNLKTRLPKNSKPEEYLEEKTNLCNKFSKKSIYNNKIFLSCVTSNWGKNANFFSKNTGNIYDNFDDILKDWIKNDLGSLKYIVFNTKNEAKNCREAMKRPLLRFPVYRIQDDQNMNNKCYRYIPNIDWSDDRVKTDEGLLEVCGCLKDKCKEYADYCKKIIDEVDKGNRP